MKNIRIFRLILVVAFVNSLLLLSSCEDMLTVESNRYVTVGDNTLSSPNDSVYSVFGLLKGMQKVGDRYILLGEMRADLLDVTEYTPAAIRQLSDFNADSANVYANPKDYYMLINNCNYFISRTKDANSPLKNENALAHAIRAWTYMQIATNWGKAYYISNPLLSVDDTKADYPLLDVSQLTDLLIADLEPFADAEYPNYKTVYDFNSSSLFLPIKVLLGDLYLWRGRTTDDYEKSATYYADFINQYAKTGAMRQPPLLAWAYEQYKLSNFETLSPLNLWSTSTIAKTGSTVSSGNMGTAFSGEMVTAIQMAKKASEGIVSVLPSYIQYFGFSKVISNLWDEQYYTLSKRVAGTLNPAVYPIEGDLRKRGNVYNYSVLNAKGTGYDNATGLYKIHSANHILLYRMGLIYLRYAEAVNRAGNPNAAFAVLKYGLKPSTITDVTMIPLNEAEKPYISVFNSLTYTNTFSWSEDGETVQKDVFIGIHARGCGDVQYNTSYKIGGVSGNLTSKSDSIEWVENAICDELALETSFEGNRFGDLMRMALRRNDPAFLAKKIAAKHQNDYSRIYDLLSSNTNNWFLPEPK